MDKNKAWEIFTLTGKVEDYLNFKSIKDDSPFNNTNADKEDKNRRTDNKTTEYR
ncbi:MAG: hypothetical protein IKK10_03390 [Clostridia bacterium]|nr:hypothetical protein [Clostridia bacterium]